MQPDLPESYYLDNVIILFEHVTRVYADLLEPRQLEFLDGFAALAPMPANCAYACSTAATTGIASAN